MTTKGYVVLLAVGLAVALVGVLVIAAGFAPQHHALVFTITAGSNHYVRYEFSVATGGTVSGTFNVFTGTVDVWVMTEAQHSTFIAGGGLSYLSASSGANGTFSADLPSGGNYFLETGHGSGYETTDQSGTEDLTINALAASSFIAGLTVIVVGAVLIGIGAWWRSRPAKPAVPWSMSHPYMPGPFGQPPMPGGVGLPPSPVGPGWTPGPPAIAPPATAPAMGTMLVTVENASPADDTVDILANGVGVGTLQLPAGASGQANVRVQLLSDYGSTLVVEAVSRTGRRAQQSVFVGRVDPAQVALRLA